MVIELRAAKERIDLLEKELKSVDNYNNAQNKILNSTIEKFENDMKRANENEAIIRKRNFDLLEKMKIIERQLIIYENNENGEKIIKNYRDDIDRKWFDSTKPTNPEQIYIALENFKKENARLSVMMLYWIILIYFSFIYLLDSEWKTSSTNRWNEEGNRSKK